MKIFIKIFLILFLAFYTSQNSFANKIPINKEHKCLGLKVFNNKKDNKTNHKYKKVIKNKSNKGSNYSINPDAGVEGKPAIYLYPQKTTKVHITLDKSVLITYDAPKYVPNKGWNVLAYPDGRIKDLQTQYTDCKKFNGYKFGLEYAKGACKANNYPYVFWEGKPTKKPTPDSKEGWIVETNNLQNFFNNKLDYIGFNKAEKDEFIRFWTKVLSEKQNKVYFIYFLQTKEVNELAPMQVAPKPHSTNRIYMVAKPLSKKLSKNPQPQKLDKFKRKGFTLVEWGGSVL